MVALSGTRRDLHLAEKRVHFGNRQDSPCPHRTVAGYGCRDVIELLLERESASKLSQFGGQVGQQPSYVRLAECGRRSTDKDRGWTEAFDFQTQAGQLVRGSFKPIAIGLFEIDNLRHEQGLACNRSALSRRTHSLKHQALMGRVLVDDDQPVLGFRNDVGRRNLPPRDS